jgi:RNA polymerase sigma-70 factor (ECF subfamily)
MRHRREVVASHSRWAALGLLAGRLPRKRATTGERDEPADQTGRFEQDILIYAAEIYRVALRLTRRPADAEDLVQETCLRAFRSLNQLRHRGAAKVWLLAILRSVFLRRIEREPAEHKRASLDDVECWRQASRHAWRDANGERGAWSHMLRHDTREAVRKLPHPYQEAVVLAHVGGFTYQEIARILGVPIGTVMSRLFRGRQLLRALLDVPSLHARTGLPAR